MYFESSVHRDTTYQYKSLFQVFNKNVTEHNAECLLPLKLNVHILKETTTMYITAQKA